MKVVILLCACALPFAWTANVTVIEPPLRIDFPPPEETTHRSTRNVLTLWTTMPIDHFDSHNTDTFQMRYMVNEEFFKESGGPIFIMVGGEWDIAPGWLLAGNMYQMAQENDGYLVYTEHRYYGETLPYDNFTTENLRYLNVHQALADLAYFIHEMKQSPIFANSKVILYGGSYAANMVLWFKQRYSHLVEGTVASSGPILGKVDYYEYLEMVHASFLSEGGEGCIATIGQGIADTVQALATASGRQTVQQLFRLCELPNVSDRFDMGYFAGLISWRFSGVVQTARPGILLATCNAFFDIQNGQTPMEKLAGFLDAQYGALPCLGNFQALLAAYSGNTNSRAWYYQTCTEYGYYQTAPSSGTVFDPLVWLTVEFYVEVCKLVFDSSFDEPFVYEAVEKVNTMFGGLEPDVNNTINIHGVIDPWRALGVYDRDLKDTSPTFDVPRASHCFDMQSWLPTDTVLMTHAQQEARRIVSSWL